MNSGRVVPPALRQAFPCHFSSAPKNQISTTKSLQSDVRPESWEPWGLHPSLPHCCHHQGQGSPGWGLRLLGRVRA